MDIYIALPADHPYVEGFVAWKRPSDRDGPWQVRCRDYCTAKVECDGIATEAEADTLIKRLNATCMFVSIGEYIGHTSFVEAERFYYDREISEEDANLITSIEAAYIRLWGFP